jgi:stearoyl-CoA desaturase (delta-9 desaturase)
MRQEPMRRRPTPQPHWGLRVGLSIAIGQSVAFAQSLYLHRDLAHKTLRLGTPVRLASRTVLWLLVGPLFGGDPDAWVATHRVHHRRSDARLDPQPPPGEGFFSLLQRGNSLVRYVAHDRATVERLTRDLPYDPYRRLGFIGKRYAGVGLSFALAARTIGAKNAAWAYGLGISQVAGSAIAVNVLGHMSSPTSPHGRNLVILAPLTAGESLHANHHSRPARVDFRCGPMDIDPGWLLARLLMRFGLATLTSAEAKHDVF